MVENAGIGTVGIIVKTLSTCATCENQVCEMGACEEFVVLKWEEAIDRC